MSKLDKHKLTQLEKDITKFRANFEDEITEIKKVNHMRKYIIINPDDTNEFYYVKAANEEAARKYIVNHIGLQEAYNWDVQEL